VSRAWPRLLRLSHRDLIVLLFALPLMLPALAVAATNLHGANPIDDFRPTSTEIVHFKPFSWLDLSINKPVIYLILAAIIAVLGTTLIIRGGLRLRPGRIQMFTELIYDFTETSIARASLPDKIFTTWFPYLATLFVFIWVSNLVSYIPLPIDTEHKWHGIPAFSLYAATANLSVTLALTVVTVTASHYVGIKENGVATYFKHWVPPAPGPLRPILAVLEVLSQVLRLVSLSVRLFANMLAGHLLIIMCLGFAILLGNVFIGAIGVPVAIVFYLFEWGLVASLQAYIFAMLSGIYIGGAIEPNH
jgi:F-type H+-transporting ATPase subunit a